MNNLELSAPLGSFYAGKTVLVTGHTGFKGSWLCRVLQLAGARVVGLALAPDTNPSLFEAAEVGRDMSSALGDVRDLATVQRTIDTFQPQLVFHLAAQALVRRSYREPLETYSTNVMGTANVLEACRQAHSLRAVVIVTTDKCYENRGWVWGYRENDRLGGADPYSSSKACAELVTAAYRKSFFGSPGQAAIGSARAGNVIGGGDWCEDRLIPDIIRGVARDEPIVIRNPRATRPWQHVLEPVFGYLHYGQRLWERAEGLSSSYNFGPRDDDVVNVGRVAERLIQLLGRGALEMPEPRGDEPHEAQVLKLDVSQARAELGWSPRTDLEQALRLTAEWYRAFLDDPGSARENLDAQIRAFVSRAY